MEQQSSSGNQLDKPDQQVTLASMRKEVTEDKSAINTSVITDEQCGKRVKLMMTVSLEVGEAIDGPTTATLGATNVTGRFLTLPLELLPIVLRNVSTKDLIALRPVNSNWRYVTSQILIARRSLQLSLATRRCMNRKRSIHTIPPCTRGIADLHLFNKCLKASKKIWGCLDKFPCVSFMFFEATLGTQQMETFFKLIGPHIKILNLWDCTGKVEYDGGSVLARRLSQVISIEDLTLYGFRFRPPTYDGRFNMDHFKFQLHNNAEGQGTKLSSSLKKLNCVRTDGWPWGYDFSYQIRTEFEKVVPGLDVTYLVED